MRAKLHTALIWSVGIVLFAGVFHLYVTSKVRDRGDSRYVLHTAQSIISEKNTDLNEYSWLIDKEGIYKTRTLTREGHIYSIYPIGTTLLTVPLVAVYDWYSTNFINPIGVNKQVVLTQTDRLDTFLAALFTALAIITIYAIGLTIVPWYYALLGSVSIALGTSAWTSAARTLWPHGPSMLMLALALWLLIKARKHQFLVLLAQIPLAYSFIIRPTNCIPLILFSIYVFIKYRRIWLTSVLLSILLLVPLIIYNLHIFGNLLSPFYYPGGISMGPYTHTFRFGLEGLMGLLVSPNRGLFIFSPFILFIFIGVILAIKRKEITLLDVLIFVGIVIHWILISNYQGWWGGWGFGPRYFTDTLPLFAYMAFLFFKQIKALKIKYKLTLLSLFVLASLVSIGTYRSGATYYPTMYWDGNPVNIDFHPERVWDWNDLQFLRR
ncbi:TPA: hypothetical protein DIV55_05395 [Patescibacteria group bacterium]|uniref:Glycosyltransferase RgtA/B/C/D-like domain-containing protein n=1 Tax=Candidatus Gottesmanbacteria bacterium GW2011_GWA1_43_11 TaxID=1618436 RepID=A0A0G1CEI3_9BACT|nr:MAG: hypothetical protein UV59_C0027G0013 [Candidatus Gottesmanbacteria bacterium GW2011_GWA1_43_11]HCS79145.1 hypothetical protein [Patescibacteria group bacterium]